MRREAVGESRLELLIIGYSRIMPESTGKMAKKTNHILLVDDDREIRTLVGRSLEKEEFRVSAVAGGGEMMKALDKGAFDLIVLDIMLPGKDGLQLCRDLRAQNVSTPIILLTAKGEEIDRIIGLEMGADDYVSKPFNSRELIARIKAVLRRSGAPKANENTRAARYVSFGDWRLDTVSRELLAGDGSIISLSTGEFDLLNVFVAHAQAVLSRDQLLDLAKGRSAVIFDRSIDIQVSRLRRKLGDDAKEPKIIKTVWGGGYIFTPDVVAE